VGADVKLHPVPEHVSCVAVGASVSNEKLLTVMGAAHVEQLMSARKYQNELRFIVIAPPDHLNLRCRTEARNNVLFCRVYKKELKFSVVFTFRD
jgi:hypothetical protein